MLYALIIPQWDNQKSTRCLMRKYRIALISLNKDFCAPMGIALLAAYLKKHTRNDVSVEIIDSRLNDPLEEISKEKYDLIGISAMTVEFDDATDLATQIKEQSDTIVAVGGVHISTMPSSFKKCFDIAVIGEGEQTFYELVEHLIEHDNVLDKGLDRINGLLWWDGDHISATQKRELIGDLDEIPLPAWDLVNNAYFSMQPITTFGEFGRHGVILTSRGCPYKCVFCSTQKFWDKVRFSSADHALEQVKTLVDEFQVTHIQIWDDLFIANKKRLIEFVEKFEKSEYYDKVKFNCQPRVNLINDEICLLLKRMNCDIVLFGFESGSDKMLKYLKGNITLELNKKAIEICVRHKMKVQGSLIFGSPTETIEDMKKTLDFIDYAYAQGVQRLWSFIMTPFPGTKIWEIALQRNKVSNDMRFKTLSHQAVDNPLMLEESIDKDEFVQLFLKGRSKLNRGKFNKILSFLKNNPIRTALYALQQPLYVARLTFRRRGF